MNLKLKSPPTQFWNVYVPHQQPDGSVVVFEVGVLYDKGEWWGLVNITSRFSSAVEYSTFLKLLLANPSGSFKDVTWQKASYPL